MNIHVPPEIAKQRQQQLMMQMQAENQLYSIAFQVFQYFVSSYDTEEELLKQAKNAIRAAEIFHAAVDEHRKSRHAEQASPIQNS